MKKLDWLKLIMPVISPKTVKKRNVILVQACLGAMIDSNSLSLLGFAASAAMIFLSVLSLLDLHVSFGGFRDLAQVLITE